jgi:hypothetical protein
MAFSINFHLTISVLEKDGLLIKEQRLWKKGEDRGEDMHQT